ncbi:MAG: hypothetical protein SH850_04125 [Planctomycetaceae bacterium]|nr:hypothetical protein [Planctomycetaceae bacterium]
MTQEQLALVLVLAGICQLALLIWFVFTLQRIRVAVEIIAEYSRRTALSLPLNQGQFKLLNRGLTAGELIALLERHGATVQLTDEEHAEGYVATRIKIENRNFVDPEWISLLLQQQLPAMQFLRNRDGIARP